MPKRRREEDFEEYMVKKIKKLKRKFQKKLEKRPRSHSTESEQNSDEHDINEYEIMTDASIHPLEIIDPDIRPESSIAPVETNELENVADPSVQSVETIEPETLPSEILEILGEQPTTEQKYGKNLQPDIALRWEYITTQGLNKDQRKEILERQLIPENSKKIDAPILNSEIKAALTDVLIKKDKAIENKQKQIASIIAHIGAALSSLLSSKDKDLELIKTLTEAGKLTCDLQHTESIIRRGFILSTIKKEVKEQLYLSKIDKYLFGEQLNETLKTAKAISKSGADMKNQPKFSSPKTSQNLNWKPRPPPPPPPSRQAGGTRRQTLASTTTVRTGVRQAQTRPAPPPPPPQRGYSQRSRMQTQHRK